MFILDGSISISMGFDKASRLLFLTDLWRLRIFLRIHRHGNIYLRSLLRLGLDSHIASMSGNNRFDNSQPLSRPDIFGCIAPAMKAFKKMGHIFGWDSNPRVAND